MLKQLKHLVIEDLNLNEFNDVTNKLKRKASIRAISHSSFSSILLMTTYVFLGIILYQGSIDVIIRQLN